MDPIFAFLYTTVGFGVFHISNVILGGGVLATLGQGGAATLSGDALHLARRAGGNILAAMLLNGLFGASLFLDGSFSSSSTMKGLASGAYALTLVLVLFAGANILRHDRSTTMTAAGPEAI